MKKGTPMELTQVVTRAEVVKCWGRAKSGVQYNIDTGRLRARRAGRGWLIIRADVERLYGPPKREPGH